MKRIANLSFAIIMAAIALLVFIAAAQHAGAHAPEMSIAAPVAAAAPDRGPGAAALADAFPDIPPQDIHVHGVETLPPAARVMATPVIPIVAKPVNCRRAFCRRTLFVPIGQKKLLLEAPTDMCFLDRTSFIENRLYQGFAEAVRQEGGQVLLGVFMDCYDLAGADLATGTDDPLPAVGIVTWMNPSIGEMTPLLRQDYLDMREASFLQYVENNDRGFIPDKTVRRTESGVALGMTGAAESGSSRLRSAAVRATTLLRQAPVEVVFRYAAASPPALENIYPLVDRFMAQQIALNP